MVILHQTLRQGGRFLPVTLLSGLNNIPDEMNRICIAEDGEIRGEMAIFVIPGRFRNRFSDHGTDSVRTATIE